MENPRIISLEVAMDGQTAALKKKLERLEREAAETAAALQAAEWGGGTPHFLAIENAAHEVGCRLSRQIQERAAREVAALSAATARCPKCGQTCRATTERRTVRSIDGPLDLLETRCGARVGGTAGDEADDRFIARRASRAGGRVLRWRADSHA